MKKGMKYGRMYFIINTDEPYAGAIYDVLKAGQIAKGQWPEGNLTFEEWHLQTFGTLPSNNSGIAATQQTAPPVNKPKELIIEEDEPCAYCCDTALVDIYLEQRGWKYCPKCGDKLTGSKSLMAAGKNDYAKQCSCNNKLYES